MCLRVAEPEQDGERQPPAKAAPNTSAPIRIAAEITVMTLGQTILREAADGCELMSIGPVAGGNLFESLLRQALKSLKESRCVL